MIFFRGLFNGEDSWRTNLLYPIFPLVGPRNRGNFTGGTPGYYQEGSFIFKMISMMFFLWIFQ